MNEPYLSAEQLGITEQEREALIKTIEVLEEEQIIFDMTDTCGLSDSAPDDAWDRPSAPCGTRACIGGAMGLILQNGGEMPECITPSMRAAASHFVTRHTCYPPGQGILAMNMDRTPLTRLFYDYEGGETPAEGVTAIKLFLRGNKFPWGEPTPEADD